MATGTFGAIPEKRWDDGDRTGWELPDPFGELPASLIHSLPEEVQAHAAEWISSLGLDLGALRPALPNSATHYIVTAAANDANALLVHVDRYDGRSAAHAARALFEHLVNLLDVTSASDGTLAQRYLDHQYVTAEQISAHRWHLRLLDRKARRREKARLDKLGRSTAAPLAKALRTWGPQFRRGWAQGTLFDRATANGLSDGYEGYRILSGVIHGSAGGLSGLVREVRGTPVHRVGPDMTLAAVAYREGLKSVYRIANHLLALTGQDEAKRFRDLTNDLLADSQYVMDALRRADNKMWPSEPAPVRVSIAGVYPSGNVRWYVLDTATQMIAVADPPREEPAQLAPIKRRVVEGELAMDGDRPVTVALAPGWIDLTPKPGAVWVPAASVLVPSGHPGQLKKPLVLKS